MNKYETQHFWDVDIQMLSSIGEPINITITEANFTLTEGRASEAKLSIEVDKKNYQIIDNLEAFNLKIAERSESSIKEFSAEKPIEIELILDKEHIKTLASEVDSAKSLIQHLIKLSKNKSNLPLLQTENWFALYVKQEVEVPENMEGSLKMGYSTKWVEKFEEKLPPSDFVQKIFDYFSKNATNCQIINSSFDIMFDYFYENRKWYFLINTNEEYNQIRLYSQYPYEISKEKCLAVCKKITEINFGLPIGNFEFDFNTAQLRFKTYLELENLEINDTQLKMLLEANIYTMEQFSASIKSV